MRAFSISIALIVDGTPDQFRILPSLMVPAWSINVLLVVPHHQYATTPFEASSSCMLPSTSAAPSIKQTN